MGLYRNSFTFTFYHFDIHTTRKDIFRTLLQYNIPEYCIYELKYDLHHTEYYNHVLCAKDECKLTGT